VRVMYQMTAENMRMFMPSAFDRLIPAGAPRMRGPVFAQAALPVAKRMPMRLLPAQGDQSPFPVSGANEDRQDAGTLAVNVYARSTLHVGLVVEQDKLLAGREFNIALDARDLAGAEVSAVSAIGRLVAPRVSTSQALQDPDTLPPARENGSSSRWRARHSSTSRGTSASTR